MAASIRAQVLTGEEIRRAAILLFGERFKLPLARFASVDEKTVWRWINDERKAPPELAPQLYEALYAMVGRIDDCRARMRARDPFKIDNERLRRRYAKKAA